MLVSSTPFAWVELACREIDAVLVDHAHCEKKAAASAMSLVVADSAREELVRRMSACVYAPESSVPPRLEVRALAEASTVADLPIEAQIR